MAEARRLAHMADVFNLWFTYTLLLLQGTAMIITLAFVMFRTPYLRDQLQRTDRYGLGWVLLVLIFSALAIYGTHAGMAVFVDGRTMPVPWTYELHDGQAIINFRSLVVVSAGLAGGPVLGTSVGAIAGLERYRLDGFTALPCGLASVLGGLLAGVFRQQLGENITPRSAAFIAVAAVSAEMVLILALAKPFEQAALLVQQISIPMLVTVAGGCYIFQQVIQMLDRDRIELIARRADIRALHAQIEPHFLMNTLNAIRALIRLDPDRARQYVGKLGQFLQETIAYARLDTITVEEELAHLQKYLDFQRLRFTHPIRYHEKIENHELLKSQLPPRSLHTLVENALLHGHRHAAVSPPISITVTVLEDDDLLVISVADNGKGIPPERLAQLGKQPVASAHEGGGCGLYHLQQTISLIGGDSARMEISSDMIAGTKVTLFLPRCLHYEKGIYHGVKNFNC